MDNGVVTNRVAVVEVQHSQFIHVLGNKLDAFLADSAPLHLESLQLPETHEEEGQGGVVQVLAVVWVRKTYLGSNSLSWSVFRRGKSDLNLLCSRI